MSDLTGINFERLDNAITWAFEHPDEYDQGEWYRRDSCGTTACIAGRVAVLAGHQPWFSARFGTTSAVRATDDPARRLDVSEVAQALLGIDEDQAEELFCLSTDIACVIRLRNEWAREAGIPERTWESA